MITVTCNGCFDGLHPGHMFYLGFCRGQGDKLFVGINSDRHIRESKKRDPIPAEERKAALMSLGFIAGVCIFDEDEPSEFIASIRPNVHCTGAEYAGACPEEGICEEIGARLVFVPRIGDWSCSGMRLTHERDDKGFLTKKG